MRNDPTSMIQGHMRHPFRILAGLLVVLALVAGAWVQGLAQAMPRVSELMAVELCADGQTAVVFLDDGGRPVELASCGAELCHDCIPVPLLAVATGPATMGEKTFGLFTMVCAERAVRGGRSSSAKPPRGPPLALT